MFPRKLPLFNFVSSLWELNRVVRSGSQNSACRLFISLLVAFSRTNFIVYQTDLPWERHNKVGSVLTTLLRYWGMGRPEPRRKVLLQPEKEILRYNQHVRSFGRHQKEAHSPQGLPSSARHAACINLLTIPQSIPGHKVERTGIIAGDYRRFTAWNWIPSHHQVETTVSNS